METHVSGVIADYRMGVSVIIIHEHVTRSDGVSSWSKLF